MSNKFVATLTLLCFVSLHSTEQASSPNTVVLYSLPFGQCHYKLLAHNKPIDPQAALEIWVTDPVEGMIFRLPHFFTIGLAPVISAALSTGKPIRGSIAIQTKNNEIKRIKSVVLTERPTIPGSFILYTATECYSLQSDGTRWRNAQPDLAVTQISDLEPLVSNPEYSMFSHFFRGCIAERGSRHDK